MQSFLVEIWKTHWAHFALETPWFRLHVQMQNRFLEISLPIKAFKRILVSLISLTPPQLKIRCRASEICYSPTTWRLESSSFLSHELQCTCTRFWRHAYGQRFHLKALRREGYGLSLTLNLKIIEWSPQSELCRVAHIRRQMCHLSDITRFPQCINILLSASNSSLPALFCSFLLCDCCYSSPRISLIARLSVVDLQSVCMFSMLCKWLFVLWSSTHYIYLLILV